MLPRRIKGFIDPLVGMVISLIVIVMVIMFCGYAAASMSNSVKAMATRARIYDFARSFTRDIQTAGGVVVSEDGKGLELTADATGKTVVYKTAGDGKNRAMYAGNVRLFGVAGASFDYGNGLVHAAVDMPKKDGGHIELYGSVRKEGD